MENIDKPTSLSKPVVEEVVMEEQAKRNDGKKPIEELNDDGPSVSRPCPYNPLLSFPQ